jgi:hypothetical protein
MNDKNFSYSINWKQEYRNWYNFSDIMAEALIESSDMREANELIKRIKSL